MSEYNNDQHGQTPYRQPQIQQPYSQPPQVKQQYNQQMQSQQQYGQQPYYTMPQYGVQPVMPGNGLATASLVCGILCLVLPLVSLILGIIAIATGASAKNNGFIGGKATAGIVMGIIGTAWNAIYIILLLIGLISLSLGF